MNIVRNCWILMTALHYCANSDTEDVEKKIKINKVYGGVPCGKEEYKSIVSLSDHLGHRCAGTLLDEYLILTAAHCAPIAHRAKVLAGLGGKPHQESTIAEIFKHPTYSATFDYHDIAIFLLNRPILQSKYVDYARIPDGDLTDFLTNCTEFLAKGWGETEEKRRAVDLMCVKLPRISSSECKKFWGKQIKFPDHVLCTLSKQGKDTCGGDSGGPLTCQGIQVGITSWGGECGKLDEPGVYSRLDSYLDFLRLMVKVARSKIQATTFRTSSVSKFASMSYKHFFIVILVMHVFYLIC